MKNIFSFVKRHAPLFLSILSAAGAVGTGIFSVIGTKKVIEEFDAINNSLGMELNASDSLTIKEKTRIILPKYLPAVGCCLLSIGCSFGANYINKKQQTYLISSYVLLHEGYKRYREKVIEKYGDEANETIEKELIQEKIKKHISEINTKEDSFIFYEPYGETIFSTTKSHLMEVLYELNRTLYLRYEVSLDTFYNYLGQTESIENSLLGWSLNAGEIYGYQWVDIILSPEEIDNGGDVMEYYLIEFPFPPTDDYSTVGLL